MHLTLPIDINQRRLYPCPLFVRKPENFVPFTFVIPCKGGEQANIFQLKTLRKHKILAASAGFGFDAKLGQGQNIECEYEAEKRELHIYLNGKNKEENASPTTDKKSSQASNTTVDGISYGAAYRANELHLYANWHDQQVPGAMIKVRFYFRINDTEVAEGGFNCFLVDEARYGYEVALDFGSEASQLAFRQMTEPRSTKLDIIRILKDKDFYNYPEEPSRKFLQYDIDHEQPLIRSRFFLRKDLNYLDYLAPPSREHPLQLLVHRERRDSLLHNPELQQAFLSLPNLKLCDLADNQDLNIQAGRYSLSSERFRNRLRRALINQMMHACFHDLRKHHFFHYGEEPNHKIALQLHLLIPNVYSQQQVNQLLNDTFEDLNAIGKLYGIGAVEILTMSESDAAFCGVYKRAIANGDGRFTRKHDPRNPDLFLIVDAGKGTLDFSVLEKGAGNSFYSRFKAGIPGSGQLLTFAVMEILARQSGTSAQDWIALYREDPSFSRREDFQDVADQCKVKGRIVKQKSRFFINDPFMHSLEGVINLMQNSLKKGLDEIPDKWGILDAATQEVKSAFLAIMERAGMEKMKFAKVIFTGRAFNFQPLRQTMVSMLLDHSFIEDPEEDVYFEQRQAKAICLEGAFAKTCWLNSRTDLVGSLVLRRQILTPAKHKRSFWKKVDTTKSEPQEPVYQSFIIHPDQDFIFGISKKNRYQALPGDYFIVGGYRCEANQFTGQIVALNIDYKGYVIRPAKGELGGEVIANIHKAVYPDHLVLKSIFPHGSLDTLIRFLENIPLKRIQPLDDMLNLGGLPGLNGSQVEGYVDLFAPQQSHSKPPAYTDIFGDQQESEIEVLPVEEDTLFDD